jgi:HD-like signal output (HDOD) protein
MALARGDSLFDAEREVLGFTHCDTGKLLGEYWGLSADVQNVIQFHHTPELAQAPAALVALVHLCDLLCRLRGMGYGYEELREVDFHESPAWSLLEKAVPHLDRLDVVRCTLELDAEADEIRALVANAFQAQ